MLRRLSGAWIGKIPSSVEFKEMSHVVIAEHRAMHATVDSALDELILAVNDGHAYKQDLHVGTTLILCPKFKVNSRAGH